MSSENNSETPQEQSPQVTEATGISIPESLPPVAEQAAPTPDPVVPPEPKAEATPSRQEEVEIPSTSFNGVDTYTPTTPEDVTLGPDASTNTEQEFDYSTPEMNIRDRTDMDGSREMIPFLSERGPEVDHRIRTFITESSLRTEPGQNWTQAIQAASMTTTFLDDRFRDTLHRPEAQFKQYLATEAGKIAFSAPKIAEDGASAPTGAKAMQRVRAIMGLGGIVSVPLYHSGFWITLEAPKESDLIELFRRMQDEKIELGRETFGLVFSNEQSYLNSYLLDFCIQHIFETNARVDNHQDLRALIKIQDLNILFWGMAALIWPRGFDYVRGITTKEGIETTQTVSAKINISKLLWVDNASFSDKHRAQMNQRQRGRVTIEQIQEYQNTLIPTLSSGRRVKIRDNLEFIVASTSAEEYITDGEAWISGLVTMVDQTFTTSAPTSEQRNATIDMHSKANRLRNHAPWIKAVVIDDHENTDRKDISEVLTLLSSDSEVTGLLEKEIVRFMDDSTCALIAIPETSGNKMPFERFPHLIAVDVLNTFFTLLAQRVDLIRRR